MLKVKKEKTKIKEKETNFFKQGKDVFTAALKDLIILTQHAGSKESETA